jgi:hypothetical protein
MIAPIGDCLAERALRRPCRWLGGLSIALALLAVDAPLAWACDWRVCGNARYSYRPAPPVCGCRSPARAYRYGSPAWGYGYGGAAWAYGYGYTSPARAYGYPYAAWSSTSIPPSRSYLNTATLVPNAGAIGLTAPVTSGQGLLESGLPPRGPSLFGPSPPPSGYYYGPYGAPSYGYYRARSYGYRAGSSYGYRPYDVPPADTPSWWAEPRRRR